MMNRYVIGAAAAAVLSLGSVAYAQAAAPQGAAQAGATVGVNQGLGIVLETPQAVAAGQTTAALALIGLDATRSSDAVAVPAIPLEMVFDGVAPTDFTNCSLRNISNLGVPLNTGANALGPLTSSGVALGFTLDTPIVVPAGSSVALALTCDISPAATAGGTATISVNPSAIPAADVTTGATMVPAADFVESTGQPVPTYGQVTIAPVGSQGSQQGTSPSGPGIPNTGAGGEAPLSYAILAISGVALLLGSGLLAKRFAHVSVRK